MQPGQNLQLDQQDQRRACVVRNPTPVVRPVEDIARKRDRPLTDGLEDLEELFSITRSTVYRALTRDRARAAT